MPLARIITHLPHETAALADYLQGQGYTVETVSPDQATVPAELKISAEHYGRGQAFERARGIAAAHGWDVLVSGGVLASQPVSQALPELAESAPPAQAAGLRMKLALAKIKSGVWAGWAAILGDASQAAGIFMRHRRHAAARWTELMAAQKAYAAAGAEQFRQAKRRQAERDAAERELKAERDGVRQAAHLRQIEAKRAARIRAAQQREEAVRQLQIEAEREARLHAERVAQRQREQEAVRLRRAEAEREARSLRQASQREAATPPPAPAGELLSEYLSAYLSTPVGTSANNSQTARHSVISRRRRDWQMAFAGAAVTAVAVILISAASGGAVSGRELWGDRRSRAADALRRRHHPSRGRRHAPAHRPTIAADPDRRCQLAAAGQSRSRFPGTSPRPAQ